MSSDGRWDIITFQKGERKPLPGIVYDGMLTFLIELREKQKEKEGL
ncbi:hypothetical protein P4S95_23435 [Aneurinibacillus aneurinilyticus]|nr:hypothetical protein [Aneurinibacillus aneurinilyticus]